MIADALDGKIDLILTKSVSRFARNTVDSLTTIRQLKDKGTEVYFEKENIFTMDSKGELLLTIMSSLAQEESRSISKNITWGKAVDKHLWELVQLERERRREKYVDMPSPDYPFRGKIFCATCERSMVQQSIKTYGGKWIIWWRCAHFVTRCRKDDDKPCTDAKILIDRPAQVFQQAWNLMVSKKTRYQATLKRTAEQNENPLVRYRAEDLGILLDEVGRLDGFDYNTYIRTVDRMEVTTGGKVAVIFLSGVRITI